jgi:hypothetical protein
VDTYGGFRVMLGGGSGKGGEPKGPVGRGVGAVFDDDEDEEEDDNEDDDEDEEVEDNEGDEDGDELDDEADKLELELELELFDLARFPLPVGKAAAVDTGRGDACTFPSCTPSCTLAFFFGASGPESDVLALRFFVPLSMGFELLAATLSLHIISTPLSSLDEKAG